VKSTELDNGQFRVDPAPTDDHATLDSAEASTLFRSNVAVRGETPIVIGYGLVTVDPVLGAAGTIGLRRTPAWVGVARSSAAVHCPMSSATTTAADIPPPTPGYSVVVIPAAASAIVSYRSRSSICGLPPTGPTLSRSPQAISAAWQEVSLVHGVLSLRYRAPACVDHPSAGVSAGGNLKTGDYTITVPLEIPYGTDCPLAWLTTQVDLIPRGLSAATEPADFHIAHDPTGPIDLTTASPVQ
jgi:hypothetical protein